MKRKIFAILALALLLIGVAYVRALFSHQERLGAFSPEVSRVLPPDMLDDYLKKDEASRTLDSLRQFYADSLARLTTLWSVTIDSLPSANVDSLQELISGLKEKLDSAEEEVSDAQRSKVNQFEKLVASFYKGEVSQLPSDLSQYEREVSIKEIKDKAQKYFGLSADALDRILRERS